MDAIMGTAGALALGMALALMYIVLRNYTYPAVEEPFFSDPSLFWLFVVGLIEGTILFVFYTYLVPLYEIAGLGFIVAIVFGMITELSKLIVLNLKRYAGRSDTIFYGFGIGLGLGTSMGFGLIYYAGRLETDILSWVIITIMAMQNIFLHAGTGIRIGEGVSRRKSAEFFMLALFTNTLFQVLITPTFMLPATSDMYWLIYVTMAMALISVVVNLYVMVCKKLPTIVSEVLKHEGKKRGDIPGL